MKKIYNIRFILLIGFILRLIGLNQSFWLDEAAQVIESSRPLQQQFQLAADFHPPLYHVILHFWMFFGHSEIWIRLLSVFYGVIGIWGIYAIAKVLGQKKAGIIAAFFLAVSPYHIWYSQETRPYVQFVALSTFATLFLFQKKWKLYTLMVIFGLLTHYFFPFLLIGHLSIVFIFTKKEIKNFFLSVLAGSIAFLYWIPSFIQQLQTGTNGFFSGWTDIVSVTVSKAVPLTLAKFIIGKSSLSTHPIYLVIIIPSLVFACFSFLNNMKKKSGKIVSLLFLISFFITLCVSIFVPVIAPQRMIFLLPFYYLILSITLDSISVKWKIVGLCLLLIPSFFGLIDYYTNVDSQREQWRQAIQYIENGNTKEAIALFIFPEPFAPYKWYTSDKIEAFGVAPHFSIQESDLARLDTLLYDKKKVYLFQYLTGLTDPNENTRNQIRMLGYKEIRIQNFPGVGFIYVFNKS